MKIRLVPVIRSLVDQLATVRAIQIDRCYHYRGFRYGGFGNNPYEDYIIGLSRGEELMVLRRRFAETILNCRPRGFAAALQIDIGPWPLWEFPWQRASERPIGDVESPNDNPDVVTHYCAKGVLVSQINREFGWLEGAWRSIRDTGYKPSQLGYIRCLELRWPGRPSHYIVLDGNHRLSALHAMGVHTVQVAIVWHRTIDRSQVGSWYRVRDRSLSELEALAIFDCYFRSANPPLREQNQAQLIIDETPLWPTTGKPLQS